MFLSAELVNWSINQLRRECHPFIGITFLAAKKKAIPVGEAINISLDQLTKEHLIKHHRLDANSEFFFQPFNSRSSWVAAAYPSSGLQAINTRTFSNAFIHTRKTRRWGWHKEYIDRIVDRLAEMSAFQRPSLAALAIWVGKGESWKPADTIENMIRKFLDDFDINDQEIDNLFDKNSLPPRQLLVLDEKIPDFKTLAYGYGFPPDAPSQMEGTLTALHLKDIGPASSAQLSFGERLTLIAGDNGLGKSFLLDIAWWALTGTWAGRPAYPFSATHRILPYMKYCIRNATGQELLGESSFDWSHYAWKEPEGGPSVAALSIYTKVDGSFAIADETRGQLQAGGPKPLSLFSEKEVWEGKTGEIEGLIRDWVSWQQSSDQTAFAMLARVLEHLSPEEDTGKLLPGEPVRIPGDPRRIPTIEQVYGSVPVVFASAGVQRILLLTYLIIWFWQEHRLAAKQAGVEPKRKMVIVVDELEAHLHPKWQRLVLPGLMSIGKLLSDDLEIQVIAATHSPMVLRPVDNYRAATTPAIR
ncbi:MAG: AAA family ATPase [Rhodobacteraceae bacterium]|nr:AAA family ATPase [Paracoccaceae bacterium]MCY4195659.1 AAA family ATPase [Paracoccaceae bacterium]